MEKEKVVLSFKPGQKRETPPPAAGTRVFYESLYRQNPDSFMALKWCIEYGVLPIEECRNALKILEAKKLTIKEEKGTKSPIKQPKKRRKKQKVDETEGDFTEGVGVSAI